MHNALPPAAIPLALVFGGYVALISLFALAYYRQYLRDRKAYAFASIVLHTQAATFAERAQAKLTRIQEVLEALSALNDILVSSRGLELKKASRFNLLGVWNADFPGGQVTVQRTIIGGVGAPASGVLHNIEICFSSGKQFSRTFSEPLSASVDLARLFRLWFDAETSGQATWQERLITIDSDAPAVWTFLDFLYFSVITQTTVGYGDILPNCTKVRLFVCSQILLGYGLLVIAVNLVLNGRG